MKQRYVMRVAHKQMRGFEYLFYSAFSLSLLIVLVLLPLAPVFADETQATSTSQVAVVPPKIVKNEADIPIVDTKINDIGVAPVPAEVVSASSTTELIPAQDDTSKQVTEIVDTKSSSSTESVQTTNISPASEGNSTSAKTATTTIVQKTATTSAVGNNASNGTSSVGIGDGSTVISSTSTTSIPVTPDENIIIDTSASEDLPTNQTTEDVFVIQNTVSESSNASSENLSQDVTLEDIVLDDEVGGGEVVNVLANNSNKFSFSESECTMMGNGSFYCARGESAPTTLHTDRIFSAVDAEGDKEIYVEKNNIISTITDNNVDDDAPYYDEVSNTAVWHRLIDGRYQIIQYDFKTKEEKQLTNDRYNNMQPTVYGDAVVWQGWVGNDWEIFLLIGEELTMLTDNTTHDIAPNINGTHIVWQSFEGDAWRMKVYDMTTGIIDTIEDSEGGSIENPRFVLVYDTKFESGDVETKGYDLKSKEVVRLASEPTSVPQDIPDPDQTGEKRALVAPSTQLRQKDGSDENDDVGTTTPNGLNEGDLVIPTFDLSTTTDDILETHDDSTSLDMQATSTDNVDDIVLVSDESENVTNTATATVNIDDLIITPFIEPIATSTDAQEIIVSEA